jgi:AcrR family transcriptional regulator
MPFTDRSAPTRAAILGAARRLLTDRGYDAMTIRAVAAAADVDPAIVMRYYGNKDGLFAAATNIDLTLPPRPDTPEDVSAGRLGATLAAHVLRLWEGGSADELITLLLRSAGTHEAAAAQLRTVFDTQVGAYVRQVTGEVPDWERRAGLIATQVLGLALCRYVLRLSPVVTMPADELAAAIAPTLQRYLFADLS